KLLKGRDIRLGVWFDMEDADFYKIKRNRNFYNKKTISSICQAFCSRVQKAGYHTGIYASYSWFRDLIEGCDAYDKWVAHWGTNNGKLQDKAYECAFSIGASIHQYSAVDLDKNVMYVDPMTFAD
ncbi:MAG: hypothetical protein K6A40_07245, partial [Solobacterium sp.]|nr:hypothetical protein [Solobacterium sp.]